MRRSLCLALAALLLAPVAVADHGLRIRLLDDKDERKEWKEEQKEWERREREAERAERSPDDEEQDAEGFDRETVAEGCVVASGGATESGNVVAWPATNASLVVQRRTGDGEWTSVHNAQPNQTMWLDNEVRKGRAYTYRVGQWDVVAGCPTVEMTAVPFAAGWAAVGMAAAVVGAAVVAAKRR